MCMQRGDTAEIVITQEQVLKITLQLGPMKADFFIQF